jgi:Zn-dependent peptidase ImmA (M78 family)
VRFFVRRFHNHLRSYQSLFYLLETGAAKIPFRALNTSEEMGDDAFVIAHEVGHALGFPHNMGASCPMIQRSYRNVRLQKKMERELV